MLPYGQEIRELPRLQNYQRMLERQVAPERERVDVRPSDRPTAESSKSRGCHKEQKTVEGHQGADPAPGSDCKRRVANYRRRVAAAQEEAARQAEAKVPRTHFGQADLNFQWFSDRAWCVFRILISKCASRHSAAHFLNISTSKSAPSMRCFSHFDFETCLMPQRRAIFNLSSGQMAPHPPL